MKLHFARLVCLNIVILLTSGILFGAIDLTLSSTASSIKKAHFSTKSELTVGLFSLIEEDDDDDEQDLKLTFLFDSDQSFFTIDRNEINNLQRKSSSYLPHLIQKTPLWIKIRHIII